jgi:ATP-binding cassette subfamily G (WHITE) protein 2
MKPGVNAIAGPTGVGKTTLLDILSGRRSSSNPNSRVLLNGEPLPAYYNCMSGYVVQEDVLMGTLTVKENIEFSASLRIPGGISSTERKSRVNSLLKELGLEEVADSKIGTKMVRGVSGGEKKRTSIAMELVASPAVLYLDEPTTGLDAFTAVQIMQILYNLAREGQTIICSIHQPRYAIFKLFDSLTLLNCGKTVYHGPAKDSINYFASQGIVCEEHANPMDIFLDALHDDGSVTPYAENYQKSSVRMTIQNDLDSETESHHQNSSSVHHSKGKSITYASGFFRQFGILSKRSFINFLRDPALCINEFVGDIFMALMVGAIYFQLSKHSPNAILDRAGALFVIIMLMIFPSIITIELFARQRILFVHESLNGYYRLMPYFLGRIGCDILPWRIAPMLCFGITAYWMIGLTAVATKFFFFMLTLLMTCLAATSFAYFYSSMVADQAIATLILAITFVVMSMYAGLFVNLHSPPIFLQWLAWISLFRYGYEVWVLYSVCLHVSVCQLNYHNICSLYASQPHLA